MRFVDYLNEEYFGAVKPPWHDSVSVFKNPDAAEMREACHHGNGYCCRFMVDIKKNNLYIWDGNVLHNTVSTWLKKNKVPNVYPEDEEHNYFWGEAELKAGKLSVFDLECWTLMQEDDEEMVEKILKSMSFADKWFTKKKSPADEAMKQRRVRRMANEEYITNVASVTGKYQAEIFRNPSYNELSDACGFENCCRFMIDLRAKNLYVWDYRVLHEQCSKRLDRMSVPNEYPDHSSPPEYYWGIANKSGGRLDVESLDIWNLKEVDAPKIIEKLSFVDRWFTEKNPANSVKTKLERGYFE